MNNEAICAIATAYGQAAISVIRTSGSDCISLVNKIFKGKDLNTVDANTINYGYILDNDQIVDEVLVSIFKSPRSFTGENSCEISCHGGIFNTNKVLQTLVKNGFRLAEPGEFSKRAFLNGRIDLTQSEAIMDIIAADNDNALNSAINSLRNSTKKLVMNLRNDILQLLSQIEVNIDYPEYDDAITVTNNYLLPMINKNITYIEEVLKNSQISSIVLHGITTALIGRPNVGKSSLLNVLLEEDKAIVTEIPGTTRDTIEGRLRIGDVTLKLIDTAGIRDTFDYVEQIGVQKSKELVDKADLVILVIDSSEELTDTDKELLEMTKDKKRIIVANKADKILKNLDLDVIYISAKNKDGIHLLENKLLEITKVNEFNKIDQNYLSNVRHIKHLNDALNYLLEAKNACEMLYEVDIIQIDLKNAWDSLGLITGQTYANELIDELFSKFCLGK